MTTTPTNIIAANTGASASTFTFTTPAVGVILPRGYTLLIGITERHLSTAPVFSSVTDSATGSTNTYSQDPANQGNAVAPGYMLRCVLTTALAATDTLTVTFTTHACDEILVVADYMPGSCIPDGAVTNVTSITSNTTVHQLASPITAPTAGDLIWGIDTESGGTAAGVSVAAPFTLNGATSTPSNRGLISFYDASASGAAETASDTWATSHQGSIGAIAYTFTPAGGGGSTASGALTLSGSVTARVASGASGTLSLSGSATAATRVTASAALALSSTVTASARVHPLGSVSISGTVVSAKAAATASGTLTLVGSAGGGVSRTAAGFITVSAAAIATTHTTATATMTLTGVTTARVGASVTGSVTLLAVASTVSNVTFHGVISLLLNPVTARAAVGAFGALVLTAAADASGVQPGTAVGHLSLVMVAVAQSRAISQGNVTILGAVSGSSAPSTVAGLLTLISQAATKTFVHPAGSLDLELDADASPAGGAAAHLHLVGVAATGARITGGITGHVTLVAVARPSGQGSGVHALLAVQMVGFQEASPRSIIGVISLLMVGSISSYRRNLFVKFSAPYSGWTFGVPTSHWEFGVPRADSDTMV